MTDAQRFEEARKRKRRLEIEAEMEEEAKVCFSLIDSFMSRPETTI